MLGAVLDPPAVLWVFVFANNGDFDAYQPRLARYHRGVDDHIAAAALDGLRELYSMVSDREGRLADLGAKKVTRALAEKHPVLRPVVALFDVCRMKKEEGKDLDFEVLSNTITVVLDMAAASEKAILARRGPCWPWRARPPGGRT